MADLKDFNHVDLLFPSKYVKAADLRGKPVVLVIDSIDPRGQLTMVGGKKDTKPIVSFRGWAKQWVLNKTNAKSIQSVYGPELTSWLGKPVILVPRPFKNSDGVETGCVRVDADTMLRKRGKLAAAPPPDEPDGHTTTTEEDEATRQLREDVERTQAEAS